MLSTMLSIFLFIWMAASSCCNVNWWYWKFSVSSTVIEPLFYTDLFAHIVEPHELNDEALLVAPLLLCCLPGRSRASIHRRALLEEESPSKLQTTHWPGEEGGQTGQICAFTSEVIRATLYPKNAWILTILVPFLPGAFRTRRCSPHMWWPQVFSMGWESRSCTTFSR